MTIKALFFFALSLAIAMPVSAQSDAEIAPAYFASELYPLMLGVQCNLCHNDNGVASDTALEFPEQHANRDQVTAFGLRLIDLVDRDSPRQSLLFLKPTNREEHTGGERIRVGSEQEALLLRWVEHLAGLTADQEQQARDFIAETEQRALQPLMIRRLTHSQYDHTVRDLLGDESHPATGFPEEDFIRGFKNQAEAQGITPLQAEAYAKAAERLAANAFRGGDPLNLLPCRPETTDGLDCAEAFIRQFGRRAFRRPLTDSEIGVYLSLFERVGHADVDAGAQLVVEAMLQSPHFLFRVQQGNQGPFPQYELASRLSYFLWDTMPSDEMLAAAARGEFSQPAQLEAIARRMLEDPRAKVAMEEFLAQWLRFDRVLSATRDRRRFGSFSGEVAAAMVEETKRLFNYLVWEDRDFMEFFTADYTFLSSDLAAIYDLPAPPEEFARVAYPPTSGRSGVLGQGSFLVATSKPAETSPTERGLFVRNHFLGHEVPPPPPGVNTSLPDVSEDKPMTHRQRLQIHLNSEACASCHRLIDPIGLGFEQYDAVGGFREKMVLQFRGGYGSESSASVELAMDTAAHVQGIDDSDFTTPKQLGRILAESEACQRCIVKQLFRYAFGRAETTSDQPVINGMLEKFRDSGFRFRELILATVTSDLFRQHDLSTK